MAGVIGLFSCVFFGAGITIAEIFTNSISGKAIRIISGLSFSIASILIFIS